VKEKKGERVLAAYALMELAKERPELLAKVEVMWLDSGYDGDKFGLAVFISDAGNYQYHDPAK
jgi:putative transposase